MDPEDPSVLYNVCGAYAVLGRIDEALDCLERGAVVRLPASEWLEQDSDLAPLRRHPRFEDIVARAPARKGQV
jgi:hypothetical protein